MKNEKKRKNYKIQYLSRDTYIQEVSSAIHTTGVCYVLFRNCAI